MKESQFVLDLKKWLNNQEKTVVYKINGNSFQEKGIPDLCGLSHGRFIAIECKLEYNKPTPIQIYQLERIEKAGGLSFVLTPNNIKLFKESWESLWS